MIFMDFQRKIFRVVFRITPDIRFPQLQNFSQLPEHFFNANRFSDVVVHAGGEETVLAKGQNLRVTEQVQYLSPLIIPDSRLCGFFFACGNSACYPSRNIHPAAFGTN